jgi:hypothetical protein
MVDEKAFLLHALGAIQIQDSNLGACWQLLLNAIDVGWIDTEELVNLMIHLEKTRDLVVEEISFSNLGVELRVAFLDESVVCQTADFLAALRALDLSLSPFFDNDDKDG